MSGGRSLSRRLWLAVLGVIGLAGGLLVAVSPAAKALTPTPEASQSSSSASGQGPLSQSAVDAAAASSTAAGRVSVAPPQSVSMVHDGSTVTVDTAGPGSAGYSTADGSASAGSLDTDSVTPDVSAPQTAYQGPDWISQLPSSAPSARTEEAMAYDSGHGVDVLFGGYSTSSGTVLGDTWTWNGSAWTQSSPTTSPSARAGASMVYDPSTGYTYLYGGWNGSTTIDTDLWEWNGSNWTELSSSAAPGGLAFASMVYSPAASDVVLFGGATGTGDSPQFSIDGTSYSSAPPASSATWTFNGTSWTHLSPSTYPSARSAAAMAYDSGAGNVVLFGGFSGSGTGSTLDDTWTFNGTTWAEQSPYDSPTARSGASMAYDSTVGAVVLFGGASAVNDFVGDTDYWVPSTGTWATVDNNNDPVAREGFTIVSDPAHGQLVLYGGDGWAGDGCSCDTQVFDWNILGNNTADDTWPIPDDDQANLDVDLGTGNLYYSQQQWSITATGVNDTDDWSYNSFNGWDSIDSLRAYLTTLPNGTVVINGINGSIDTLDFADHSGSYTPPPGLDATLAYSSGTYTLTFDSSQESYTFPAPSSSNNWQPMVTAITDRNGDTLTDSNGGQFTDDRGVVVQGTWTYPSGGLQVTWTDNVDGRQWVEYATSGAAYPTTLTDAASEATQLDYTGTELTEMENPDGDYFLFYYDYAGRVSKVIQVTNPGAGTGPTTTFDWQAAPAGSGDQWEVVVTDPNGHQSTYLDGWGYQTVKVTDANNNTESGTYSADRHPQTLVNGLTQTETLAYDTNNNPTSATEPATGSDTPVAFNASYTTTGSTGSTYLPSSSTDGEGNCSAYTYDSAGNQTTTYYGLTPTTGTDPNCDGDTSTDKSTNAYQSDGSTNCGAMTGELCSSTDPNGNTTSYAYDTKGQVTSITSPGGSCTTTARKLCTSYSYAPTSQVAATANGNATALGATISAVQSDTVNLTSGDVLTLAVTLPSNVTAGDALVLVVGSDPGPSTLPTVSSVTGGGVNWIKGAGIADIAVGDDEVWYGLDSTGGSGTASITVTMNSSDDNLGAWVGEYSGVAGVAALDASGTNSGTGTTVTTPSVATTVTGDLVLDAANNYNAFTAAPASPWTDINGPKDPSGEYDNPLAYQVHSGTGSVSTTWTQSPTGAWAVAGIALRPAIASTAYSYDAEGRVTQVLYDGTTTCNHSAGTCISFTYDADGNLKTRTDVTGTTTFVYDDLGRLTNEELPSGANACPGSSPASIEYGYDNASNLTSYCDAGGTVTYAYDPANRLVGVATGSGSCTLGSIVQPCTQYGYNDANQLTSITYPTSTGWTATYTYYNNGAVKTLTVKDGSTTEYSYSYSITQSTTEKPLIQSMTVGSTTNSYGYNGEDELCWVYTGTSTNSCSSPPSGANTYTYDDDGNMLTNKLSGTTHTMTYNTADELCWAYVGTSSNACASPPSGSVTYSYDNAGNQTTNSAGQDDVYNTLDQASSMTNATGGNTTAMAYAGIDNALRVTAGSTTETNNAFGVAATTTSGTTTYYTDDPTGRHNSMLVGAGGSRYYYIYDGLGNVIALINSSGSSVGSYTYDAYGNTTVGTGSESSANPFRYEGGYQDPTGNYHYGARYYNTSLGAWTQLDPSGQSAGYSYAGDDPINVSDPEGLDPCALYVNGACVLTAFWDAWFSEAGSLFTDATAGCGLGTAVGLGAAIISEDPAEAGAAADCVKGAVGGVITWAWNEL